MTFNGWIVQKTDREWLLFTSLCRKSLLLEHVPHLPYSSPLIPSETLPAMIACKASSPLALSNATLLRHLLTIALAMLSSL